MDYLKQFVIPFRGLKLGEHHFDFEIDDKFFDATETVDIEHGQVHVDVDLTRQERMLILECGIAGRVELKCDRCLEPYDQPVSGRERLIVKFGEDWDEESDEVIIIPESEYQIDISQYLYEFINLLIPMQHIHPDDENGNSTCDPDMIARLGQHSNEQASDPRWDALKKLKK